MMNKLEINLAVAKDRRRAALKALDEVRVKQIKAAKVVSMLQAEKDTLADVQEQINNIRLDAMETGETTAYLPTEVSKKYGRLREIDEVLPAALRRQEALTGERQSLRRLYKTLTRLFAKKLRGGPHFSDRAISYHLA